jgi:uncharacterized membrane protein
LLSPGGDAACGMQTATIVGVILVILGVAILVVGGFNYTTTRTAAKIGPVGITTQEKRTVPVSPVVGGVLVVGGARLLFASRRLRT